LTTLQYGLTLTGMLSYFYFTTIRKWKSLENLQDIFLKTKTKTKTLLLVLEAPRDQDLRTWGLHHCKAHKMQTVKL